MCVDLHLHSTYSDGTSTPLELVRMARQHGLTAISLTDHDTVDGLEEITAHATRAGLPVLPGIELNSTHGEHTLHILGYGFDPGNDHLLSRLNRIQEGRRERNLKIVARLKQLGIPIDMAELESIAGPGQIGRPHFAALLVQKGVVPTRGEAFRRFLRQGAPAWVDRFAYSAAESIDMIHQAGGIAIFAHPGQLDPGLTFLPLLIYQLAERGLDGLETYYPSYSRSMQKRLLRIANTYKLIGTGGSDYHGSTRGSATMAGGTSSFRPPASILDQVRERLQTMHYHTNT